MEQRAASVRVNNNHSRGRTTKLERSSPMTRRHIQRLQCHLRRGVNELYRSYLVGVLQNMQGAEPSRDIGEALATLQTSRRSDQRGARSAPVPRTTNPLDL